MTYYPDTGHIPEISNDFVIMQWQLMSTSLEAFFAIMIEINHICFCIVIHVIKLIKDKTKCASLRMT